MPQNTALITPGYWHHNWHIPSSAVSIVQIHKKQFHNMSDSVTLWLGRALGLSTSTIGNRACIIAPKVTHAHEMLFLNKARQTYRDGTVKTRKRLEQSWSERSS